MFSASLKANEIQTPVIRNNSRYGAFRCLVPANAG